LSAPPFEDLWRDLAPQVLAALVRRYGHFADAEDAVQEALAAASTTWPETGRPVDPRAWLVRVASRRLTDRLRSDEARRRREDAVSVAPAVEASPSSADDSLLLLLLCCPPSLTPGAAIPLALRAVAGLSTREIATAFLVGESTMAQRISRAKARLAADDHPFGRPSTDELPARLPPVLHVLYLLFNEGYAATSGTELARADLSDEAIRLARAVHAAAPDDPEVAGLLALLLLTDARRPARTGEHGELVPLDRQDRSRWDRRHLGEGLRLVTEALRQGRAGEYQLLAAVAGVHAQAATYEQTDWGQIAALYRLLQRTAANPLVTLNLAVATAMVDGPAAGLALLDQVAVQLSGHHRWHAVRGNLLEQAGDRQGAAAELRAAAAMATNLREQHHLHAEATRVEALDQPGGPIVDASGPNAPT
jgi:RNA polymerase sigma factor (sigma-70 family)